MLTRIKNFFESPEFPSEEKTRRALMATQVAQVLLLLATMTLLAGLAWVVRVYSSGLSLTFIMTWGGGVSALTFVALSVLTQVLVRSGQVRFASVLITLSLLTIFTVMIVFSNTGIRTPFFSIYLIAIFVGAILLGRDWAIGLSLFVAVVAVGLIVYETSSAKLAVNFYDASVTVFFMQAGIIMTMLALFYVAVGDVNRSLYEVRLANRRLETLRTSLEERVAERTQDVSRRARYLTATADVARYISSEWELAELLSRLVMLISERFDFYHAGIFLVDVSGEWAELQAASSRGGQKMLARGHRLRVGQVGTVGYVTAHGEARIALDVGADAVFFNNPDLPDTRSAVTLPLRSRNRIIGALDVQSTESSAFTEEDATVLQALADQVALAISNARLFERLQESVAAERRAYGELSYRAWADMLHARGGVGYVDDAAGTHAINDDVIVGGADSSERMFEDEATVAIPVTLREGGDVLGIVRLRKSQEGGGWTPEQIAMMESITEQMGVALERARLYQDSRRSAMRERLVGEATSRMRQSLEVESVLKTAVDEIYRALELEEVTVRLTSNVDVARAEAAYIDIGLHTDVKETE